MLREIAECIDAARRAGAEAVIGVAVAAMQEAGVTDELAIGETLEIDAEIVVRVVEELGPPPKRKPVKEKRRIAPDWKPTDQERAYAVERGFKAHEVDRMVDRFRDHYLSSGARWLDWKLVWMRWVRTEQERRGARYSSPPPPPPTQDDGVWRDALRAWRTSRTWPHPLGPEPGKPGCRVPAHLLDGVRQAVREGAT